MNNLSTDCAWKWCGTTAILPFINVSFLTHQKSDFSFHFMSDKKPKPTAVVLMIDNSSSSINGDFHPSRLEAQKLTIERYAEYLTSQNTESQIAVGSLASTQFGIHLSFTSVMEGRRIIDVVSQISPGGDILLSRGLKVALLALKHCNPDIKDRKMVIFIASRNDVDDKTAEEFSALSRQQNVTCEIVIVGNDVPNESCLAKLVPEPKKLLVVHKCDTVLSDDFLSSAIGQTELLSKVHLSEYAKRDPRIQEDFSLSKRRPTTKKKIKDSLELILEHSPEQSSGKTRQPGVRKSRKEGDKDRKG